MARRGPPSPTPPENIASYNPFPRRERSPVLRAWLALLLLCHYSLRYDNENDRALKTLLDGEADAMFVYADQAYTYSCADKDVQPAWDCDLWSEFGTKFAYIHTGMFETAFNGTTLTMSKRGSGLSKIVNPCIDKFITTKSYYDICVKHDFVDDCYANEFFPEGSDSTDPWELPTSEQTGDCSSGYCGC